MSMQHDRYNSSREYTQCLRCAGEYVIGTSRARDNAMFCSKKCEIESRFWLKDVLDTIELQQVIDLIEHPLDPDPMQS